MSRIRGRFQQIRQKGGKAFIPYLMAGDHTLRRTAELFRILEDCGADIIELGVPFSDPLADGPTIQEAAMRSLRERTTLSGVLDFVGSLRSRSNVPIVLMTYYNPVFKYGEEKFVNDASSAGADGVIIPDLPPEEATALIRCSRKRNFDTIFLVAPTSTDARIKKIAKAASGFIYYVSMTGITGSRLALDPAIEAHIGRVRNVTELPVAVGFGISTPDEAAAIGRYADGVIVGSAIVKQTGSQDSDVIRYVSSLREALK